MLIGRYKQQYYDRRRRVVAYTGFLGDEETITMVESADVTPVSSTRPLIVDDVAVLEEGKQIEYYVSGGEDGETYKIELRIVTSIGQRREDEIEIEIEEI